MAWACFRNVIQNIYQPGINMLMGIVLYTFCCFFVLLVVGDEAIERHCKTYYTEVPVIQMCDETDNFYSFPKNNASDLNAMIHMNRRSLPFNLSTVCSCNITIQPVPQLITWRYRASLLGGCRLFPTLMSESNTQECLTDTFKVNESSEYQTLFNRQMVNNNSYICFGVGIEDAYVDGRSFNVTCSAAETSPIPLDADPNAFEISTKLDLLAVQLNNMTDKALELTYSTALVFEKKQYESSSFYVKPTENDAKENSKTTRGKNEAFGSDDTIQSDDSMISTNVAIFVSAGCVGVILLVAVALVYRRYNRRKEKVGTSAVRYTITVQRNDDEDLVVTDNLVYNLDEEETNVENIVNGDSNHYAVVNNHEDADLDVQCGYTNTNHVEVEYTNSLEIGMAQSEKCNSNQNTITEENTCKSEQDVLTDDEKMDLYANKSISRKKSLEIEDGQVYSNELCEERSERSPSENETNQTLQHSQ